MSIDSLCSSNCNFTHMHISVIINLMHCSEQEGHMTHACMASVLDMHVDSTGLILCTVFLLLTAMQNKMNDPVIGVLKNQFMHNRHHMVLPTRQSSLNFSTGLPQAGWLQCC